MKVLVVGGYGTFGGRTVELLEGEPRLILIVAGRSLAKADAHCKKRAPTAAQLVPALFDRDGDLAAQLAAFEPDIVVDASGPFQAYGEGRYRLIEACIARRINYLDLADGSDFVAGVSAFDEAARNAGVFVLSGVSSFPVLTAAVVRRLSSDLTRVDGIRGGIAPSPSPVSAETSFALSPVTPVNRCALFVMAVPNKAVRLPSSCAILSRRRAGCRFETRCFRSSTFRTCVLWPRFGRRRRPSGWELGRHPRCCTAP
ncbi:saccharopine dehydrogenase NADP-binding domain-containing protein [Mesorhizobium sp. M0119]|uniref:saccharopine dehydrogenase NADP-binding domain-containing protein n=1 Tax=unclassified Mesorhizobium TaxID=325217 RepID=UPI00333529EA